MPKLTWELLRSSGLPASCQVRRFKVPGGWLIYIYAESTDGRYPYAHGGLTFYPDPEHKWDGGSTP
jgi:hypothetical protein